MIDIRDDHEGCAWIGSSDEFHMLSGRHSRVESAEEKQSGDADALPVIGGHVSLIVLPPQCDRRFAADDAAETRIPASAFRFLIGRFELSLMFSTLQIFEKQLPIAHRLAHVA